MKFPKLYSATAGLIGLISAAGHAGEAPILKDNQAVIQVKGVVCSFCAYGTEKNLAKLSFLNPSYFDGDGVLLDINTHRITLALNPKKKVDYSAINQAILDGGYDPIKVYVRAHGFVSRDYGQTYLTCSESGQVYRLEGSLIPSASASQAFFIQGDLPANMIAQNGSKPLPLKVTLVEEAQ